MKGLIGKLLPENFDIGAILQIRDMIADYVKFSKEAQLVMLANQQAIGKRLQTIEAQHGIACQPDLLPAPALPPSLTGIEALDKINGDGGSHQVAPSKPGDHLQ